MASLPQLPFVWRRPLLLWRNLRVDRWRPDLEGLAAEQDPETFVWRILPHAARTFSPCILLLPAPLARATAVAYLFCRVLDTYEDLLSGELPRQQALAHFAARLTGSDGRRPPAHALDPGLATDGPDAAHLLLVNRCGLVDRVYDRLEAGVRALINDLVKEMSEGMRWSAAVFARQGGCLWDAPQLERYCYHVLGAPIVFCTRLMLLDRGQPDSAAEALREDAVAVGEFIQLANITRDIEKDLARGRAYHPLLASDLRQPERPDPSRTERVRQVRAILLGRALARASAYRRLIEGLGLGGPRLVRASAVLMLLFTERYYLHCARQAGWPVKGRPPSSLGLLLRALLAGRSAGAARRRLRRSGERLARLHPAAVPEGDPAAILPAAPAT